MNSDELHKTCVGPMANKRINATVRLGAPLATASGAPSRPARYALR